MIINQFQNILMAHNNPHIPSHTEPEHNPDFLWLIKRLLENITLAMVASHVIAQQNNQLLEAILGNNLGNQERTVNTTPGPR